MARGMQRTGRRFPDWERFPVREEQVELAPIGGKARLGIEDALEDCLHGADLRADADTAPELLLDVRGRSIDGRRGRASPRIHSTSRSCRRTASISRSAEHVEVCADFGLKSSTQSTIAGLAVAGSATI